MSLLSGLGGIIGGIGGFLTGGVGGAVTGYQAGQHVFGGGGGPSHPQLPTLGPGGSSGGGVIPYGTGINQGPFIGIPPMFGGPSSPQPGTGMVVHGHWTKGTRKNPSHWTNRRRPRMNPMNVRAGRRAITRIRAAEKLFHRFLSVSHPGHTGRVKPKRIARR